MNSTTQQYNGCYLGLVIQNNDPDKMGRVKVFVPYVSYNAYDGVIGTKTDKAYKFPDDIYNPELVKILPDLKTVLPWASYAGPMFGGGASGRYNAVLKKGTTSDSNVWDEDELQETGRPLQKYVGVNAFPDAFNETSGKRNRFVNQYSYQYTPSDYSDLARGFFTLPNVGAHVWVWFIDGDPNYPVYFASAFGQEDFKRLYTMNQKMEDSGVVDYPGSFENVGLEDEGKLDSDGKTFRSKHVFNSNKHTIEFIDTDLREILKFTHYSGSFLEFNNYATIQLATNNDQKMVIGDQFLTVRKNQSIYVAKHQENIIEGDQYLSTGTSVPSDVISNMVNLFREIHETKRLFDIQRATALEPPQETSSKQLRSGLTGTRFGVKYNNGFAQCPICDALPYQPTVWSKGIEYEWNGLANGSMIPIEDPLALEPALSPYVGLIGYYAGLRCDVCNNLAYDDEIKYPYYWYPGFSPASFEGLWMPEDAKLAGPLNPVLIAKQAELAILEKQLGDGGDQIIDINKNKVENIGLMFNDLKSFRIDPIGKLRIEGVYVAPEETYESYKASPHVEYVNVDNYPGGDYNCTVGNKYKLIVGSKGVNIKTTGPMDIHGTIVNFTGEQLNIGSRNEVNIEGGERFSLRSRRVTFTPYDHNPVTIEGQLHVTRNTIIKGGTMQEGELGLMHITAPFQWYITEPPVASLTLPDPNAEEPAEPTEPPMMWEVACEIRNVRVGGDGALKVSEGASFPCIIAQTPHAHYFKMLPTTLLSSPEQVRNQMNELGINTNNTLVAAQAIAGPGQAGPSDPVDEMQAIADGIARNYAAEIGYVTQPQSTGYTPIAIQPYNETTQTGEYQYSFTYEVIEEAATYPITVVITYIYNSEEEGGNYISPNATVNGKQVTI